MKKIKFGFTLIEILVVISLIGAMSVIGLVTLNHYTLMAQDSVKKNTLASLQQAIMIDSATRDDVYRYVYTAADMSAMLKEIGFPINPADKESCFFVSTGAGADLDDASDNRFAIMAWGRQTSTFDENSPGVLILGDSSTVEYVRTQNLTESDFHCNPAWVLAPTFKEFKLAGLFFDSVEAKNNKTTICHIPPGNPGNYRTIEVGNGAVDAHLAHGDYEGVCNEPPAEDPAVETEESSTQPAEYGALQELISNAGFNEPRSTVMIDSEGHVIQIELLGF